LLGFDPVKLTGNKTKKIRLCSRRKEAAQADVLLSA